MHLGRLEIDAQHPVGPAAQIETQPQPLVGQHRAVESRRLVDEVGRRQESEQEQQADDGADTQSASPSAPRPNAQS